MNHGIKAEVVLDSISQRGNRITTLQLRYHRYIHGEFMTHRVFSRNASSSRAIPIKKMLAQVWNDPAMPVHWGQNRPGMQAKEELQGRKLKLAKFLWRTAAKVACVAAWSLDKIGMHKQIGNRILEPWQFIHVVVTSTEWDNFFSLRDHPDAQPEIQVLARSIKKVRNESTPNVLAYGDWHMPYIQSYEHSMYSKEDLLKLSTARCARVSYLMHDGAHPNFDKDIELHDRLVGSKPIHASPAEHVAQCMDTDQFNKNFRGWYQYRSELEKLHLNWR